MAFGQLRIPTVNFQTQSSQDLINNECANALADTAMKVRVVSEAPTDAGPVVTVRVVVTIAGVKTLISYDSRQIYELNISYQIKRSTPETCKNYNYNYIPVPVCARILRGSTAGRKGIFF